MGEDEVTGASGAPLGRSNPRPAMLDLLDFDVRQQPALREEAPQALASGERAASSAANA
jgi:hypothetical protein